MQEQVKAEPRRVAELRATFLKLAGAMEGAMVRLGEAGSRDLYSVSQYYSRRLVSYIRRVLQVGLATEPREGFIITDALFVKPSRRFVASSSCRSSPPPCSGSWRR